VPKGDDKGSGSYHPHGASTLVGGHRLWWHMPVILATPNPRRDQQDHSSKPAPMYFLHREAGDLGTDHSCLQS
jgi:hypothetical protein